MHTPSQIQPCDLVRDPPPPARGDSYVNSFFFGHHQSNSTMSSVAKVRGSRETRLVLEAQDMEQESLCVFVYWYYMPITSLAHFVVLLVLLHDNKNAQLNKSDRRPFNHIIRLA